MSDTIDSRSQGIETPTTTKTAGGEDRHNARARHILEAILWCIGLITLVSAGYYFHFHRGPLPGEFNISRSIQALHLPQWFFSILIFFSSLNDIPPSIAAVVIFVVGLAVMRWFRQAIFLALTVGVGNAIDALIGDLVGRPRPDPHLIHVTTKLTFNSFPSGHTEHDTVFYGFLLYLSLTKPVREWRYRWILLPFQIFGLMAILLIGFSRLYEGEHWLTDVLGGYLSGALWLFLFIWLYRWTTDKLARRKMEKQSHQQLQSQV